VSIVGMPPQAETIADLIQAGIDAQRGVANGIASLNSSALVPTSQMGTGTADSTVFLRGDGAWAAPTASGVPSGVKKSADQTTTSSTLADVTSLTFSVTSGSYYHFRFIVLVTSSSATGGPIFSVSTPTTTTFGASVSIQFAADGASAMWTGAVTSSNDPVTATDLPAASTSYLATVEGTILPSANGSLSLRFGSEDNSSTITVKQGSLGFLSVVA